jgi:two-component system, OmpR family, response regulator VicR
MSEKSGPVILYIDDEPGMVDLVKLVLGRKGCTVVGAHNAEDGIEIMAERDLDLVLLDLMMPERDGWEVYRHMKATESLANLPVIIISARNQPIEVILAKEINKVDDYVEKPFGPSDLVESVERILGPLENV